MGMIFATFQSHGSSSVDKDCSKMRDRMGAVNVDVCFKILLFIPSTPDEVETFSFLIREEMPEASIFVGAIHL